MEKFTCKTTNQTDLVRYLETLGHEPSKIINQDHWYLSPFRYENIPSFKVNQKLNVWYDHGMSSGGKTVDFGIEYFRCTVSEFLQHLNNDVSSAVSVLVKKENQQSLNTAQNNS